MQVKEAIDRINDDIVEVISHFVELKQQGRNYQGCCPFHNEKTPSFSVSPSKGIYKCFGCGKGGDAISFVMDHEKCEFMEAVRIGSKKLNLQVDWQEQKRDFNEEEYKHKESLRIVCGKAAEYFQSCLKESPEALAYLKKRNFVTDATDPFMIGYAPSGNTLIKWAGEQNLNLNTLQEAGLIATNDQGQRYDFFRDRIMFPICEKNGKVIAFTGRTLSERKDLAKYMNTGETDVFKKGNELFALNIAKQTIRNQNRAYIVEGNFDVKRLHSIGITNAIAPCGTALTEEQVLLLKQYTRNVTLIYDGDKAGKHAITKNGELLVKNQFNVAVLEIPDGEDPDTLFPSSGAFEKFTDENKPTDFIIFRVLNGVSTCQENPSYKSEFIKEISCLISKYDEPTLHDVYMDGVSQIIKPKKAWQDALKSFLEIKAPVEKRSYIPKGISAEDLVERGFYEERNCYYFMDSKSVPHQKSNFIMKPLFHVESSLNAKRLYEVTNITNIKRVIEVPQKDLVSLTAFQIHIESLGNFWFDGTQADLNRLKRLLYEKTESCKEIVQLGWQKEGFWAWGNGIFNGKYTEADDFGIIRHHEKNYYIPATSKIFDKDEGLYRFERSFIHIENNITLNEYAKKYINVFGENAKIALCFYFAALFRDLIVRRFGIFPILNMFGPKGAGKTACAESLCQFFGKLMKAPNVHNTSKPALGEHVASSCNAIAHIDEYRNDIDMEKREFLKGLWDGVGRTKMNMEKDKKKETTSVDQAIVLTGQQMATADIALFSRLIFLSFTQTEYTEKEEQEFVELKAIEKRGMTHITHHVLKLREVFKNSFDTHVKIVGERMHVLMGQVQVESRIFNNWMIPLAAYSALADHLELPWDKEELLKLGVKLMIGQNKETKKNDDLGNFWKVVQFLISSNILLEGGDYKVKYIESLKRHFYEKEKWQHEVLQFEKPKRLFFMTTSRVFSLYKSQCLKEGEKPMPDSTIEYYLKNSPAFICETKKESFKKIDPKTNTQETDEKGEKKRTSTTALVFDLDKTNLSIGDQDNGETEDWAAPKSDNIQPPELPF
jgi:DNA primase